MDDFWDPSPICHRSRSEPKSPSLSCHLHPQAGHSAVGSPQSTCQGLTVRACERIPVGEVCKGACAQEPHLQGLNAASDEVGDHAHAGPLLWVLRQELRSGLNLLQVLNDGQLSRGEQ